MISTLKFQGCMQDSASDPQCAPLPDESVSLTKPPFHPHIHRAHDSLDHGLTRKDVMSRKEPPSFALGMPGSIWIVCLPAVGHRQANSTVFGMLMPGLDLFCQIPVVSTVSVPSMSTLS